MTIAAALSLLCLLLPQQPEPLTLNYADGDMCSARVLSLTGDKVRLAVDLAGGHLQVTRRLDEFTPQSIFAIEMAANPPHDYAAHLAMAERAADLGLIAAAGSEARAALDTLTDSPDSDGKRSQVRAWGADALQRMLDRALAENRIADARHCLKLLTTRMAEHLTEPQLDALAQRVEHVEEQQDRAREAARKARLDERTRAAIEQRLEPIQKELAAADRLERDALRKSGSTVAATQLCERAVSAYQDTFRHLETLLHDHPGDAELERWAEVIGKHVHDATIRAELFAANMATIQSDYRGAAAWANKVLLVEPDNAEAHAMLRTIEISQAAASGVWRWGWGWGWGGSAGRGGRRGGHF